MTTQTRLHGVVEIYANTGDTNGEPFLERAKKAIGVWGGMSWSDGVVDDGGRVSISFNPDYAEGGAAAVLRWLDSLGIEYTAEFSKWVDR